MANNLYNEESIVTETPREFTRRAPSTYLGSSRRNTNLVKEIFANAVDEHVIGHGKQIDVDIDTKTNTYIVKDHGQGFIVNAGIDNDGETILQRSFDKLNTSGKTSADGVYQGTALGLNGIGAKLTNWLSSSLNVITYRDGQYEELDFTDGIFENRKIGKTDHASGTTVTWHPDPQFFKENTPDEALLNSHFEVIAAFCPELTVNFTMDGTSKTFTEPGGINAYVDRKVKGKELFTNRFVTERSIGKDKLNICITYTSDYNENINAYVNLGLTDAGEHIKAFHTAFVKAVNKYANDVGLLKKNDRNFTNGEIAEGLYVVCNMTTTTAKYEAQNKSRVDDIDAKIITAVVGGDFASWLINNPSDAKIIVDRALQARKAREAAQKAKAKIRDAGKVNKKNIFVDLPSKLSDAYPKNKKDRSKCELYICLKGDTKIKLLNGTAPTIESLVGQEGIWAYSTNERGSMIPAQIKSVFKTQDVTQTMKLTFDDGSVIECTPEHKFLDRDTCSWVEAKDLSIGQSMFSMKFKRDEYSNEELVYIPNGDDYSHDTYKNAKHEYYHGHWEAVHKRVTYLMNSSQPDDKYDIRHKDFNQLNKVSKIIREMLDKNITITEDSYNAYAKSNRKYPISFSQAIQWFGSIDNMIESGLNYDLKIVNIEYVNYEEPIPVYCLNIDNPFHSFVLDNGIITHNCEGDSAGSSINAVKDSSFQACFPIRGKILCCQKAAADRVLGNMEIANIVKALGLDVDRNTGKLIYDAKKLRYNYIVFATDEDADGYDISLLLLTVFNWLCPELISNGHIYRVHGALFKATFNDGTYKTFQTDAEFEAWKKTNTKSYKLSRAKGLGELTSDETYEQLVNPATRDLVQLTTDNMDEFNEYLEMFKGADVAPRRDYLEAHFADYDE